MITGNILQNIQRAKIEIQLEHLKMNPLDHGFSDEYVHYISELDHWGQYEAEMQQLGEEIRQIRREERMRNLELSDFTSQLNTTQSFNRVTELDTDGKKVTCNDKCNNVHGTLHKSACHAQCKIEQTINKRAIRFENLAIKVHENENYLYDCSLPIYGNEVSLERTKETDAKHFRWVIIYLFSTITTAFVAVVSFKNEKIKKIHPSQLIGAMAVLFLLVNWHIFVWQIGEVDIICYSGVNGWLSGLLNLFGGTHKSQDMIKILVHSNQKMFQITLQTSLILNTFLSIDLIYSNKDPLKPSRKRIQMYFIITFVSSFVLFWITSAYLLTPAQKDLMFYVPKIEDADKLTSNTNDFLKEKKTHGEKLLNEKLGEFCRDTIFLLVVTIVSSVSIGFADTIKSQGERSDGNKVKVEYMKKHLIFVNNYNYIWGFFLANSYYMMHYYMDKIDQMNDDDSNSTIPNSKGIGQRALESIVINDAFVFLVMAQGILLAVFRFREPVYYYMIKIEVRSWFGLTSKDLIVKSDECSSRSAFSLMIQQLCTDLVYTMLYTVTKHTVGIKKQGYWTVYQDYDFKNNNKFLIETMLVKSSFFTNGENEDDTQDEVGMDFEQILHKRSEFGQLEENQKQHMKQIKDRKSTEKRIEEFDLGKMLGNKFQQKYMMKIKDQEGKVHWEMKDNNIVEVDGIAYTFVDREIHTKEFAPDVFAQLRSRDGFTLDDIEKSLSPIIDENIKSIFKAGEGMGKSGSFFFFSHDTNFLIKTMTMDDFNAFMYVFKYYFEHINQYPDSLIARIYGVYSVQMDDMDPVYLIMMGNTKQIEDKYIKKIYDLKGSMVKRIVKGEENGFKHTDCLKDQNILAFQQDEIFLKFQEKDIEKIVDKMEYDLTLLQSFNLMDYSLLFVVAYNPKYIETHPDEFVFGEFFGEYKLKNPEKNPDSNKIGDKKAAKTLKNQTDQFVQMMTGYDKDQFKIKQDELKRVSRQHGIQNALFDYKNMKNPYKEKDINYNFGTGKYEGEDAKFELEYKDKVIFPKTANKSGTIEALNDELLEEFYPDDLKCFQKRHTYMSDDGMYLYHLGIIDYLQDFNINKKGENYFKGMIDDATQISAVHPKPYAERFYKFMQETVVKNQKNHTPIAKKLVISDTIATMAEKKLEEYAKDKHDEWLVCYHLDNQYQKKQFYNEIEARQYYDSLGNDTEKILFNKFKHNKGTVIENGTSSQKQLNKLIQDADNRKNRTGKNNKNKNKKEQSDQPIKHLDYGNAQDIVSQQVDETSEKDKQEEPQVEDPEVQEQEKVEEPEAQQEQAVEESREQINETEREAQEQEKVVEPEVQEEGERVWDPVQEQEEEKVEEPVQEQEEDNRPEFDPSDFGTEAENQSESSGTSCDSEETLATKEQNPAQYQAYRHAKSTHKKHDKEHRDLQQKVKDHEISQVEHEEAGNRVKAMAAGLQGKDYAFKLKDATLKITKQRKSILVMKDQLKNTLAQKLQQKQEQDDQQNE